MKRFFAKLARFFWSWGFLKFVLWTVTLVVLFYAEEDWRGARAWAATKAKWEARGDNLDLAKFTPPPVLDSQNLGAIPLFTVAKQVGQGGSTYFDDETLRKALQFGTGTGPDLPIVGGWIRGKPANVENISSILAAKYAMVFKKATPADPLEQFQTFFPFLPGLRAAAAERPFCHFAYDDSQIMPAGRALGLVVGQIRLAQILAIDGLLAVHQNQPDLALSDYATILKLGTGTERDPSLVGGLVSAGQLNTANGVVWQGLAYHAWSNAQLGEIENRLSSLDFFTVYRFDMSAEAAVSAGNLDYFRNVRPSDLRLLDHMIESPPPTTLWSAAANFYDFMDGHFRYGYDLWPRGWFDLNKVTAVNEILNESCTLDDHDRRVDLAISRHIGVRQKQLQQSVWSFAPWNVIAIDMTGPLENTPLQFCFAQVCVDEARIACALERYWLAHHAYPASLDALASSQITALPHDVINGEPYQYRLRPDGTYLLYSVGWDQHDDGGKLVLMTNGSIDLAHGDWVWPSPK